MTRIAVQGLPGCFSEVAAAAFAPGAAVLHCNRMEDAFAAVREGRAEAIALPVYNSIAGYITAHLDLAAQNSKLREVAETEVRIELCVLAVPDARMQDMRRALSHPVALAQCSRFFAANPRIRQEIYFDTAGAAEHIAHTRSPELCALASERAARQYSLAVLQRGVQDSADAFTRFLLLVP